MNRTVWRDNLREIKKSWPRFLSILLIMLLGVAFFVGIKATSPAMLETTRRHFERYQLPDGQVLSTLGLDESDIKVIQSLGLDVEPLKTLETTLSPVGEQVKVYPYLAKHRYFYAVEGRLPESIQEIALDMRYQHKGIKIGDVVTMEQVSAAPTADADVVEGTQAPYLAQTQYTVVGFVDTPIYFSRLTRGVGNVSGFVVVHDTAVAGDVSTELFFWQDKARAYRAYEPAYNALMEATQSTIEAALKPQATVRFDALKQKMMDKVTDGQKEIDEGYRKLADGQEKLDDAKKKLDEGRQEYEAGQQKLADGEQSLAAGQQTLRQSEQAYQQGLSQWQAQSDVLSEKEQEYENGLAAHQSGEAAFEEKTAEAEATIAKNRTELEQAEQRLNETKTTLENGLQEIVSGESTLAASQQALVSKLKAAIPDLEQHLEKLKQQAEADELDVTLKEQVLSALSSTPALTRIYLKEQQKALQQGLEQLAAQRQQAPEQLTQVQQALATIAEKMAPLQTQIEAAEANNKALEAEVSRLQTKAQQLAAALETAQSQLASAKQQYDALNSTTVPEAEREEHEAAIKQAQSAVEVATQAVEEAETAYNSVNTQLESFQQQQAKLQGLKDAYDGLSNQQAELSAQQEQLQQLLSPETEAQITARQAQAEALAQQITELDHAIQALSSAKDQLADSRQQLATGQAEYDAGVAAYEEGLAQLTAGEQALAEEKAAAQAKLEAATAQLEAARAQLDGGWQQLFASRATLTAAESQLQSGRSELTSAEEALEQGRREADDAKRQLADGEKEYQDNRKAFEAEKKAALQDLQKAQKQLDEAKEKIDTLERPKYYTNLRDSFDSYESLYDNAQQIKQISQVFPLFFFAIAALVTFTTIKRMVSEQRNYMGTMKQMGYPNAIILSKFVLYALLATSIGIVVGIELGYRIFPPVIMNAYNNLFHFDEPTTVRSWPLNISVALIALACALIPAIWTPIQLLRQQPAHLLQPEAPKAGKKILLERIPLIWRHLSFNRKMTIRNLLRYKGRNLMTLIGVAGCTMLIVTGFGISDTIEDLVAVQFKQLHTYNSLMYLDDNNTADEVAQVVSLLKEQYGDQHLLTVHNEQWQTSSDKAVQNVSVMVPIGELSGFIQLRERHQADKTLALDNSGVVISERLAEYVGVKQGDKLTLVKDGETVQLPIAKITENYIGHYVYMSPEVYRQYFAHEAAVNAVLVKGLTHEQTQAFEQDWNEDKRVLTILNLGVAAENVDATMGSLGVITLVLILSAAALAFVVLYNLTNINISERIRELSTIKVLGFYSREVSLYIYDEILILTLLGSLLGLALGTFLNQYILKTIQMPNLLFYPEVSWQSYLISAVITFIFASVVMLVMHQKLKAINMVEALKAVE
ncbi:FtsX-like permease family protein [Tuanshanicoccus lijuaniae]|uniref:FtsX-like permease family protein n=1 Tax=Aerococcaceae bacterium zg-1292 TaxID=2774330 RepID=UPI001BD8C055|nr:FtsX-like permease family protein [Aerococcaceae bacterium zg-A91]MBS4457392.1 FtsX-like permease family protein [Aerococcaceae bacterium zg-BR33]